MMLAKVSTAHFEFIALGTDEDDATRALLQGWRRHVAQTGADPKMMRDMLRDGDVNFTPIVVGQVLRDGTPLLDLPTT